jgi:hypothetical protein
MNDTEIAFINHLSDFLPDRKKSKTGPHPIDKNILTTELFKLFKTNCGWRNIKHPSTCRNYLKELQRRGEFKNFFNLLTHEYKKFRQKKTIVDSSDIESYKTNNLVKYSGKYHNYCLKMTVEFTPNYVPIDFRLDKGTESDSHILDKMLDNKEKLPYELLMDMGYERYSRRRYLKRLNCQVRIEMKKSAKNRKRGRRYWFSDKLKKERGGIEKVFAWLKSFMMLRLNRLRIKSLIQAMLIFCLSFIAFRGIVEF